MKIKSFINNASLLALMNDFQERSYLKVIRVSKDLNERLLDFAKNEDLPYRLKSIEEVLIQNGTRIQLPIQYGYYKTISDALNIDNPVGLYNDKRNFVEILTTDYSTHLDNFIERAKEEIKINTDFLSEFEKIIDETKLKQNVVESLKDHPELHGQPLETIFIDKFYDNSHIKYSKEQINTILKK